MLVFLNFFSIFVSDLLITQKQFKKTYEKSIEPVGGIKIAHI